ncbi:MAG: hypothetical protein RBT68_01740 [Spirochaetia bacterium]|jgi:hypothetical protein|nr:hypothetical protein [Spirochaetia bacterium]
MKRSLVVLLAFALAMSLASCTFLDELLSVNLFEETMDLSVADVNSSSVGDLLALSESESFFEAVEDDPALETALLGKADEVIATSSDPLAIQEAGILAANVLIYTSPAGDLLANATGLADADPAGITNVDELLNLILPASVYSGDTINESAFREMIDAFLEANEYYVAIGTNLGTDYLASEVSAGDIAVGAYLGAVLVSIDPIPLAYSGDVGDYLYAGVEESEPAPAVDDPDLTQLEYAYLDAILDAASLGELLDL